MARKRSKDPKIARFDNPLQLRNAPENLAKWQ